MRPITVERTVQCQSDVCSVWTALTDTDRLNRAMGNGRLFLTPLNDGTAARYLTRTRIGGFTVDYEERPYEWVYLKKLQLLRRMRNGPVSTLEMTYVLTPLASGGTEVSTRVVLTPRSALLAPVVGLSARQVLGRLQQTIQKMDEEVAAGRTPHLRSPPPKVDAQSLDRAAAALAARDGAAHVRALVELIRRGSDLEVSRLRPYVLASEWGVSRSAALATCLRAVKAGLLELRWDIVCPSCRTATTSIPSLAALGEHGACQLCDIQFGLELDQAVEATFAPAAAIRKVDEGPYCISGPARTPHVVSQAILPAGGVLSVAAPDDPGKYRLFVRGGHSVLLETGEGAPSRVEVEGVGSTGGTLRVAPGGEVRVANSGRTERHAKIERLEWLDQAASARDVTAMPEFRREFSSDVLRPGSSMKVSKMGLFFSDLSDSTRLYATSGDAAAFKLVQEHFDVLVPIIERNGGAVVKTIGDAIMAAFADDMSGLKASLEILSAFDDFRRTQPEGGRTHIKLGFYSGPCFVLTANNVLDYFGQTVNVAARLQGQARGGELVIEEGFADEAIRAGVLSAHNVVQRYEAELKGLDEPLRVARVMLHEQAARDVA